MCVACIFIYVCMFVITKKVNTSIYMTYISFFFLTGDTVSVVAKITNSSSRRMIPKFSLLQTTRCCVGGHTHGTDKILYEAVGKTIKEDTEETITCLIKIPVDATPTFFNCEMISVHYSLKVGKRHRNVTSVPD